MRVVIALGGNALLRRGQPADAHAQEQNVRRAARAIALVARHHQVVVTHGNGPQVGLLALESEGDPGLSRPYPLDVIGAETEGMIGYWLQRELRNALPRREIATILTQTIVDLRDPAFTNPTKFVGQCYDAETAARLGIERGWELRADGGSWRRVVPSPRPLDFIELGVVRRLVDWDVLTICAGGGGIPIARVDGGVVGVEAVVDKDLAAALLAERIAADALVMLTDVPAVLVDYGTERARPITNTTPAGLRCLSFAAGSMGPKVDAACTFVEQTGGFAAIGALDDAPALVAKTAGTVVHSEEVH